MSRSEKGDLDGALADCDEAIRLKPDYANTFCSRAVIFQAQGRYQAAVADFQKYLDLGAGIRNGDQQEVEQKIRDLKAKLKRV